MKTLITNGLFIGFFLFCCSNIIAQSFAYRSLTTKDGLPSNTVYQIKQDKKGFIWIATANGLARYDGKECRVFNPKGIKDKEILGILIDNKNRVWFWNLKGQLFYIENQKIIAKNLNDKKIVDFAQNTDGIYWFIAKSDGLYQLKDEKKIICIYKHISLQSIHIEADGVSAGFGSVQTKYKNNGTKVKEYLLTGNYESKKFIKEKFIFNVLNNERYTIENPKGIIFNIDNDGFFKKRVFKEYESLFKGTLTGIYQDKMKNYWITTTSNTYIFDKNQKLLNQKPLFPNESVNYYFNDREGEHWFAIMNKGIRIISSIDFVSNEIPQIDAGINALFLNENNLLIGTNSGNLIFKNLSTKNVRTVQIDDGFMVRGIEESSEKDKIWLYSFSKAVYLDTRNFEYINDIGDGFISYKVLLNKSKNSPLLIGAYNGAFKIPNNEIINFIQKNQQKVDFSWNDMKNQYKIKGLNNRTYAIEKVKNEYWFGSTDGLYYSNGDTAFLTNIPQLQQSWITNIINQNDTVWVSTQTDGLFQIINKKVTKIYNEENGLISNQCKRLIVESNGIVWVGTNNGINKININTGEIDLINNIDGLLSNDINALVANDKNIFVGTSEGLTTFNKNISTKNKVAPPIYLSKFQIYDKDTILLDSYVLRYNQNNIRIHFTGISFRSQGTFKYKYRMQGISNEWTIAESNIASFPILNPDEYTFEAYAINEDGVESENPIRIKIIVKAPFWQTWWFWFLIAGIIALVVWQIEQGRIKRIEERLHLENDFQQKINALKMQALQAQMNPHFIFNALNAIQHYLLVGKGEQAMIYLAKFAKLIRMIFEFSKQPSIPLTNEIEFLKLYLQLEKLRFKHKITVDFKISPEIYTDDLKIPSLLIQPIIENSFKHGLLHKEKDSKLFIEFIIEENWIKCVIEDNGIGRERAKTMRKYKNKTHKSSGVKITEERLNIWIAQQDFEETTNQKYFKIIDLKDENGNAAGTKVEMILGCWEAEED